MIHDAGDAADRKIACDGDVGRIDGVGGDRDGSGVGDAAMFALFDALVETEGEVDFAAVLGPVDFIDERSHDRDAATGGEQFHRVVGLGAFERFAEIEALALIADDPGAAVGVVFDTDIDDASGVIGMGDAGVEFFFEGAVAAVFQFAGQFVIAVDDGVGDGLGEGDDQTIGGDGVAHAGGQRFFLEEHDDRLHPIGAGQNAQMFARGGLAGNGSLRWLTGRDDPLAFVHKEHVGKTGRGVNEIW